MGDAVLNILTDLRTQVKDTLAAAGINASDYVGERITPPIAIVVPDDPYVSTPVGANPFNKPYTVNIQVLLIAPKLTNSAAAQSIDELIVSVVDALDDYDLTEVTAPSQVTLPNTGGNFGGALVRLNTNTHIEKEVI